MTTHLAPTETTTTSTAKHPQTVEPKYRRHLRLLFLIPLALVTTAAALLGASSPANAATSWRYQQLDSDWCWDAVVLDANGNGAAEDAWYDLDNDCRWDTHLYNTVGADNLLETLTFDMNEDGRWEVWAADNNQRMGFDVAYFDNNGDGYYDSWKYITVGSNNLGTIGGGTRSGTYDSLYTIARYTGTAAWR